VLTTRFNDGQISKTDLLQVQSRLKEAELNKSAAYKDYQIALQNLNVLMGVPPMTPVEIADAITTAQPVADAHRGRGRFAEPAGLYDLPIEC